MKKIFRFAWVLILAHGLSGCTTLQPMPLQHGNPDSIAVGDRLHIRLKDATTRDLTVVSVDGERISGKSADPAGGIVETNVADIEEIKLKTFSTAKTAGAAIGIGATAAIILTIIMSAGLATAFVAAL
ncbi:hypothetical protein QZM99_31750 [Burkholderia gladioli]|uniref:hypothetical protein n=1 Tax=Burkholderia gladioli TaxID=28095 RepID=UPI00264CC68C|nr:hypothetical protein [Burkholderia gladioli]MDN7922657.1 hypothetical protein [Burkholderia gladioli]